MKSQRLHYSRSALSLMLLLGIIFILFIPGNATVALGQAAELSAMLVPDSYEPNDTAAQAKPMFTGTSQTHSISPASDVDWIKFTLAGTSAAVTIETSGAAGYDTRMWLYNSSLTELRFSDDEGTGFYSYINTCDVPNLPAGTYYVKVDDFNNDNEIPSYTISISAGNNCLGVSLAGTLMNSYPLFPGASTRQSFAGANNGPVHIFNADPSAIIASERVIYKVNGVNTSFTEMMALPNHQLDTTFWLPWYNNVDLDTQLRFTSLDIDRLPVSVEIGGVPMPGSPFILGSGESIRVSFPGVNDGPVKIQSSGNLVASARVIYKVNGTNTSFSEMMALPNNQLQGTFWLPWYNNVDLDTQIRIANPSIDRIPVSVLIGGELMPGGSFVLDGESSIRLSFPGVNNGPVQIVGSGILASERVIYRVSGTNTSFSEMMALPNNQLHTTYWLPWYNNVDLDTQLRFGNVSGSTASVHVYIGLTEMPGSPFSLLAGQSTRVSFTGVNNGPVKIVSNVNIVAAERVIYKVNGVPTSFSEMMALPDGQLNTDYWLPWYNNLDVDTQLRFGIP